MLVTVYITNYNYAQFVRQSIESVLSQTFKDYELIVIDDGSTDNSREIIEEYRGLPNVTVLYQENKGLNVTNNIAMRKARGKYLMRLDADDFLEGNALEAMVARMESDPETGLVFSNYYYVDESGNVFGEERRHDFDREVSLYDQPAHGACTLIRLDFLREVGGYDEAFSCQDGYDLWARFVRHYKVRNVGESLFYYRRHTTNLTLNENRILGTRKRIKASHVERYQLATPATVAIIPVSNRFFGGCNWPLYDVNGKTILQNMVETVAESSRIQFVVVATAGKDIVRHIRSFAEACPKLVIVPFPDHALTANRSTFALNSFVLDRLSAKGIAPEAFMTISLTYPFLTSDLVDEAINTLVLFKADSLVSVRPDNNRYFQHYGHGMAPVVDQDKFTKLEREAIYRGAGGIVLSRVDGFLKEEKMLHGKVGHIVVDERVAFAVDTEFDFLMFRSLAPVELEEK